MAFIETLKNKIRTKFKTDIETALTVPVLYDNDPRDPRPDDSLWIRLAILLGTKEQVSLGDKKRFRQPGIIVASIFTQIGKGTKDSDSLADSITTAFQAQTVNGVVYMTPYQVPVGRQGQDWQANINCPFYSDFVET